MAPIVYTAEYVLLRSLVDNAASGLRVYDKRNMLLLNNKALDNAISNGYVRVVENFAHITDAGYDRLDEIEDGK